MRRLVSRLRGASRGTYVLASALILAAAVAPFAVAAGEGLPIRGGSKNPASGRYTKETQIWARNAKYGTRQSNTNIGDGGGAIYGCRSNPGNEPCVRAHNLRQGRAFEFQTGGMEGGYIGSSRPGARPFSTNATGVATGLNADQVDGKSASDFASAAQGVKGAFSFNPQGSGSIVNAINTLNQGTYQLVSSANGNTVVNFPWPLAGRVPVVSSGATAGGATPANCQANYSLTGAAQLTIRQRNQNGNACSAPFSVIVM